MQGALCGKNLSGNDSPALHIYSAYEHVQEYSSQMLLSCPDFSVSSVWIKQKGVVTDLTKIVWCASMTAFAQSLHWDRILLLSFINNDYFRISCTSTILYHKR